MLSDKGTNIFSEIGKFFKENDATSAMNAIMDTTKALRLSEKRLFGSESKCNCKLTQLQVLGLLMLFPCFMIRNYCCPLNIIIHSELTISQRIQSKQPFSSPYTRMCEGCFSASLVSGGLSIMAASASSQSFSGCSRNPCTGAPGFFRG